MIKEAYLVIINLMIKMDFLEKIQVKIKTLYLATFNLIIKIIRMMIRILTIQKKKQKFKMTKKIIK